MQVPLAPTDSLYKFMAISGVIIFLVAPFALNQLASDKSDQMRLTLKEANEFMQKLAPIAQQVGLEENLITDVKIKRANKQLTALDQKQLDLELSQAKRLNEIAKIELDGDALLRAQIIIDQKRADEMFQRERWYKIVIPIIGGLGAGLATLGFSLWYDRLQKYIDAEIRNRTSSNS